MLNASRRMQKRKEKKEEEHKDYSGSDLNPTSTLQDTSWTFIEKLQELDCSHFDISHTQRYITKLCDSL